MRSNLLYPLIVWFFSLVFLSLVCTCWPVIRLDHDIDYPVSFLWKAGFFCGVFCYSFEFSLNILICLYLLFFLFTAWFNFSERFIKFALILCFLIWIFVTSRSEYPGIWLHPFFMVYSVITIPGLLLFKIYSYDRYYD